jgi:anaerobic magnesium-protoporphyrin IX monomethyl ester cyclase
MNRLRVFLVNCGIRSFNNYWVVPPMGILSLAAYLRDRFPADLMLVNQRLDNWGPAELGRRAGLFEADVVGLSALTPNAGSLNSIIRAVRAARPNAFVVIGGPHASAVGASVLDSIEADAAILGEGEVAFEQTIRARFDGGDLGDVPGLVWRAADGTVVTNPGSSPIVEDLDSLPMPAYDLIDLPKYWHHQTIAPILRRKYVSLITSRGCPYQCIWCHSIFGKRIRMTSAERVVEEVAWFQRKYNVKDFEFIDDTFNFKPDRVIRVCDLLRTRGLRVKLAIPNGIRGDILTQEQVDALADAGLYHCMIALESGSPRIQKLTRKHLNIPRFLEACEMVARKHVYIHTCCMIGFPSETEEEMQQTIDVACQAKTHTTSFFTPIPFPGTPLYDMVKEGHPEKLASLSYDSATYTTVKVNLTDLPDEVLYGYQRKAARTYALNLNRLFRLLRDHPQPWSLPLYVPLLVSRALRGMIS